MKIYMCMFGGCDIHNEAYVLRDLFATFGKDINIELTNNVRQADLIIITSSCVSCGDTIRQTMGYIAQIINRAKATAEIILSGCLADGFKNPILNRKLDNLSGREITIVPTNTLISMVTKKLNINNNSSAKLHAKIPFYIDKNGIVHVSPCKGCSHGCKFCKQAYYNFKLESLPIKVLHEMRDMLSSIDGPVTLDISSSNLSLYGFDFPEHKKLAHEAIKILSSSATVDNVWVGFLIDWYDELCKEIIRNWKISTIHTSLETGSPSLYADMNRPITLNEWVEYVKKIRQERPDILVMSEIIAGFPGETEDDVQITLELIQQLGIYIETVWPYNDSPFIPSGKSQCKLSAQQIEERRAKYVRVLKPHNDYVAQSMGIVINNPL